MDISKIESRTLWTAKLDIENMKCEAIENSAEFSFLSFFFVFVVVVFLFVPISDQCDKLPNKTSSAML